MRECERDRETSKCQLHTHKKIDSMEFDSYKKWYWPRIKKANYIKPRIVHIWIVTVKNKIKQNIHVSKTGEKEKWKGTGASGCGIGDLSPFCQVFWHFPKFLQ